MIAVDGIILVISCQKQWRLLFAQTFKNMNCK